MKIRKQVVVPGRPGRCTYYVHVNENSQICLSPVADSHSNRDRHTNFKTIILILYRIHVYTYIYLYLHIYIQILCLLEFSLTKRCQKSTYGIRNLNSNEIMPNPALIIQSFVDLVNIDRSFLITLFLSRFAFLFLQINTDSSLSNKREHKIK